MLKGKRSLLVGWLDAPSALPRGMARKLASHTSRRTIPSNGLQHDAFRIFVRPSEVINGYSYTRAGSLPTKRRLRLQRVVVWHERAGSGQREVRVNPATRQIMADSAHVNSGNASGCPPKTNSMLRRLTAAQRSWRGLLFEGSTSKIT